ncbi:MAG TPA: hypothetical protein VK507_16950, partial [Iamia sp.]|nr:hypothetical protein [Iamia sp.]
MAEEPDPDRTTEGADVGQLMVQLLIQDIEEATAFADDHPELRTSFIVAALISYRSHPDGSPERQIADAARPYAEVLCGPRWTGGPDLLADLWDRKNEAFDRPDDAGAVVRLRDALRAVLAVHGDVVHPVLAPGLFDEVAELLARVHMATGDAAVLREAIVAHRRAFAHTPDRDVEDRYRRLDHLAFRLALLHGLTGDSDARDEAVALAGRFPGEARLRSRIDLILDRDLMVDDDPRWPQRLADATPALREPACVLIVVRRMLEADEAGDERQGDYAAFVASVLCGLHWLEGPNEVAGLAVAATSDLDASDEEDVGILLTVARAAVGPAFVAHAHPDLLPRALHAAATCFLKVFEYTGDRGMLDEAVDADRAAVAAGPRSSIEPEVPLGRLAQTVGRRFQAFRAPGDLDEAIELSRRALASADAANIWRPELAIGLASWLRQRSTDAASSGEAVAELRRVLGEAPVGPRTEARLRTSLSRALAERGQPGDLDDAIEEQRIAVRLDPSADTYNGLGMRLSARHVEGNASGALEEAIAAYRSGLAVEGEERRADLRNNLSNALEELYRQTSERRHLDEAVTCQVEALDLMAPRAPNRPLALRNLSHRYAILSGATGRQDLMERAIQCQREAVALTATTDLERAEELDALARWVFEHFEATGSLDALAEAVTVQRDALASARTSPAALARMESQLAQLLEAAYQAVGAPELLDEAIGHAERAVDRGSSTGHPGHHNTLANCLRSRHRATGAAADLDRAVSCSRRALELLAPTASERPGVESNLARLLIVRYQDRHDDAAGREAEALLEERGPATPLQTMLRHTARAQLAAIDGD